MEMSDPAATYTGLTYDDLASFPDDNLRRELIDGELIVTAAPVRRHQRVILELASRLLVYVKENGGEVYVAPLDVKFSDANVVEPDVLYIRPEHVDREEPRFVSSADLVVEVSSPSMRRLELVRKRELYQRFGVPEYWYVDLDADRVEVYRLCDGMYGLPTLLGMDDTLTSPQLPGFVLGVRELLEDAGP
ncbi:MAG: Uma2 family endonuclease [Egibacteraceae bacterium]